MKQKKHRSADTKLQIIELHLFFWSTMYCSESTSYILRAPPTSDEFDVVVNDVSPDAVSE